MRFTITSQGTDIPLQLDISGYILTVSAIYTHSISVFDSDGRLAVCKMAKKEAYRNFVFQCSIKMASTVIE